MDTVMVKLPQDVATRVRTMAVRIKTVYRDGVFKPIEPIPGLVDDQVVEFLMVTLWPADAEQESPSFWSEWEAEWADLSPWEREGRWPAQLTPEQIQDRLEAVRRTRGLVALDDPDLALDIVMNDEYLEENLPL